MKKHQKHIKLQKPNIGHFHRNELAFVGAPCSLIQDFVSQFKKSDSITYIDADHAFGDQESAPLLKNELTDKIKFYRYDKNILNDFAKKILLNDQSLILLNGNHFQANQQMVFIHTKKEASLKKRLSQLTDVKAYILCDDQEKPFDWLLQEIGEKPTFSIQEFQNIQDFIEQLFKPVLVKSLLLAGGKSSRMGEDKSQMNYHGISQIAYLTDELKKSNLEAFISCQENQHQNQLRIVDKLIGLGPFGGILSAFQEDPNSAWLVVACDLPYVNQSVFDLLLKERDPSKFATCFHNPETGFPDPLITIWEPKSYMRLLEFLALGYSCPRKVLINSEIKLIHAENADILKNVNTPEERDAIKV